MNANRRALFVALSLAFVAACGRMDAQHVVPMQGHGVATRGFSTSNVPAHLLTAIYGTGYAGVVGPATFEGVPIPGATYSSQAPYLTWAYTDATYISNYHGVNIKTIAYSSYWLNSYATSGAEASWYTDLAPGGANAGAEGTNCSGQPINLGSSSSPDYINDPHKTPYTLNHANFVVHSISTSYDAVFGDNTAVFGTAPCDYSTYTDWVNNTNTIDGQVTMSNSSAAQLFLNAIGEMPSGGTPALAANLVSPSNVLGLMCEECYIDNSSSPYKVGGTTWQGKENGEIATVQKQKIFWDYARNCGTASSSTDLRLYELASFLLTYDPSYTMLQECFVSSPSDFAVMPESQLVPEMPTGTGTDISSYQLTGTSIYLRHFKDCYYKGTLIGACAVAVNSDTANSYTIPSSVTSAYTNSMVLSGGGVLDGGSVSFTGSITATLPALTGEVLVNTSTYTNDVLSASPTRFYKLDDASGTSAKDYSSHAANGTYLNNVTFGVSGPILTESSKAISVPGSSSGSAVSQGVSANVPSGGFAASGTSWSAEMWGKPTLITSSNNYDSYYALWGQDGTHRLLMNSVSGQLLFQFNANSTGCSVTNCNLFSTTKLTGGVWHYIVATYDASTKTAQLYIDGTADASETFSVTTNAQLTGTTMYLSQYDTGAYYKWDGVLADWAFYPTTISSSTVSQHYTDAGY